MEIAFVVYGTPVAQGRVKNRMIGGFIKKFDPKKSADYKNYVRQEALKVRPESLLEGPISIRMTAYMPIPGMSKKKRLLAIAETIRPITRPDVKNIFTGVEDALKSIIWKDDSQVVTANLDKFYSEVPRVEVTVKEL